MCVVYHNRGVRRGCGHYNLDFIHLHTHTKNKIIQKTELAGKVKICMPVFFSHSQESRKTRSRVKAWNLVTCIPEVAHTVSFSSRGMQMKLTFPLWAVDMKLGHYHRKFQKWHIYCLSVPKDKRYGVFFKIAIYISACNLFICKSSRSYILSSSTPRIEISLLSLHGQQFSRYRLWF